MQTALYKIHKSLHTGGEKKSLHEHNFGTVQRFTATN